MAKALRPPPPLAEAQAERLRVDPSVEVRTETAAGVAAEFSKGKLTEEERRIAVEILEVLARDVERQVREALSEHLKKCPFLPAKLARTLAIDVETVALPIIRYSSVLSDDDLVSIVRAGSSAKQAAISKRETVSAGVAVALVDTGNEEVVGTLLANRGAEISERCAHSVLDKFGDSEAIQTLVVGRPILPLTVTERLIGHVSAKLRERIICDHGFPPELADDLIKHGQEKALIRSVASNTRVAEVENLAATLQAKRALTPTLVLRALCVGDLHFFEASMAAMAGMSITDARNLIFSDGARGIEKVYGKTDLPIELFRAFCAALEVAKEARKQQLGNWRTDYTRRIIRRIVRVYDDVCPEDLEHVLSLLSRRVNQPRGAAA